MVVGCGASGRVVRWLGERDDSDEVLWRVADAARVVEARQTDSVCAIIRMVVGASLLGCGAAARDDSPLGRGGSVFVLVAVAAERKSKGEEGWRKRMAMSGETAAVSVAGKGAGVASGRERVVGAEAEAEEVVGGGKAVGQ